MEALDPATMTSRDVFISHSSGDAEVARDLRSVLEQAGYSCWMAPDDIVGTETWTEQILGAIADSKAMIVLVSSAANRSAHVSREVNLALGRSRAVLPIRIENVPPEGSLEYLLSLVQRVDAFPPPVSDHSERILRRVETIVRRPESEPAEGAAAHDTTPVETADAKPVQAKRAAAEAPPTEPAPASPDNVLRPRQPIDVGPGSVVGAFMVEALLGQGGMATVYRARQEEPRRLIALKVIRADHTADETYRKRFLAEKETLAALEHPSIVPIYAAGESNGVLYIAMRLVDGPDLQARIASEGRLSLRETVGVLEPIADAVDYAHAAGVVHRDLKPSNIILDRAGRPYLTDFGLGKHLEVDSKLSVPGVAIGTLDFMAPEQFTGATDSNLAPSIDIYALGCVAFQCLTGQPPFVRETPAQLMYAHAHEAPPSVRALRPELPPEIDAVFARVLAKDPRARFESAREFVAALESVGQSAAAQARAAAAAAEAQAAAQAEASQAAAAGQAPPAVVPPLPPAPAVVPPPVGPPPIASPRHASAGGRASRWVGANTALAVGGVAVALVLAVVLGAGLIKPGPSPSPTRGAVITPKPATPAPTIRPTPPPPTQAPTPTADLNVFPNELEAELLAIQPASVDTSTCHRFEDKYVDSLAMIFCNGPTGARKGVFFVLYADEPTMTSDYTNILSAVGLDTETETGCFDLEQSNHGWSYVDGGTAGPQAGLLACYPRSESGFDGIQYVWTHDELKVMGLWLGPDYQAGLDYFDAWVTAVRP